MRRTFDACGEGATTQERLKRWRQLQEGEVALTRRNAEASRCPWAHSPHWWYPCG
jgi:hypothetical protein